MTNFKQLAILANVTLIQDADGYLAQYVVNNVEYEEEWQPDTNPKHALMALDGWLGLGGNTVCGIVYDKQKSVELGMLRGAFTFAGKGKAESLAGAIYNALCQNAQILENMESTALVDYSSRITSERIVGLKENQVFVFGSIRSGIHGAGAAALATRWGAKYGIGEGLQKHTYALPSVDVGISRALSANEMKPHVNKFIECAIGYSHLIFLVTEVGCGLAGLTPEEVAPLFTKAIDLPNVHLPLRFWKVIEKG